MGWRALADKRRKLRVLAPVHVMMFFRPGTQNKQWVCAERLRVPLSLFCVWEICRPFPSRFVSSALVNVQQRDSPLGARGHYEKSSSRTSRATANAVMIMSQKNDRPTITTFRLLILPQVWTSSAFRNSVILSRDAVSRSDTSKPRHTDVDGNSTGHEVVSAHGK